MELSSNFFSNIFSAISTDKTATFFLFDPDHLINKNAFNNNCHDEKN